MKESNFVLRTEQQRDMCLRYIEDVTAELWRTNKQPEIKVRVYRKRRSLPQNALMHVLFSELAREMGVRDGEVKDWFKAEFGPKRELMGKAVPVSTAAYDVVTAQMMIEQIYAVAAEQGFVLSSPDQAVGW